MEKKPAAALWAGRVFPAERSLRCIDERCLALRLVQIGNTHRQTRISRLGPPIEAAYLLVPLRFLWLNLLLLLSCGAFDGVGAAQVVCCQYP